MSIDLENIIAVASAAKAYKDELVDDKAFQTTHSQAEFITTCNPETVLEMAREIQRLQQDESRLDFLTDAVYDSRTGVTIDRSTDPADKGYRVMWFHKQFSRQPDLRKAIDAAMGG